MTGEHIKRAALRDLHAAQRIRSRIRAGTWLWPQIPLDIGVSGYRGQVSIFALALSFISTGEYPIDMGWQLRAAYD